MRKKFILSLILIIAIASFLLGFWQIKRFLYKRNLNININKDVQLFSDNVTIDLKDELTPFMVIGNVVGPKKYFFFSYNTYKVLVPIKIIGSDKIVYTDLGISDIKNREYIHFSNTIAGVAYVRFHKKNYFVKNNLKSNLWFWYDFLSLSQNLNGEIEKYTFYMMDYNTKFIKSNTKLIITNIHLFYVFFWYFIFLSCILFFCHVFSLKK